MWLALVLWLVMCVGELGVVSQSVLAMYAWIALFALPYFYRACRHALDALVEETLLFVAEVVRGGGVPALTHCSPLCDLQVFGKGCRAIYCPKAVQFFRSGVTSCSFPVTGRFSNGWLSRQGIREGVIVVQSPALRGGCCTRR